MTILGRLLCLILRRHRRGVRVDEMTVRCPRCGAVRKRKSRKK